MPSRFPVLSLLYPCKVPGVPSDYSSLHDWERSWEKTFALVYGITGESPSRQVWRDLKQLHEYCVKAHGPNFFGDFNLGVVSRQADLAIDLMDAFARRDFESRWRAYTHEEQQDIILQGLCRTAEMAGRECSLAGSSRFFCPDASLRRLVDRDGEGFLDLAKSLLASNLDTLGICVVHVHYPVFDHIFSSTAKDSQLLPEGVWRKLINDSRSYYLTELVMQILRVLRSETPVHFTSSSQRMKHEISKCNLPPVHTIDDPFLRKVWKTFSSELKANAAEPACAACFKAKADLPARHAYKRCAGCAKIDYEVLYCSRECQVSHWKDGKPPHKEVCGRTHKQVEVAARRRIALPPAPWLPKADPGFTHTPALLHHIVTLRRDKSKDLVYVIFGAEPGNDISVRMPEDTGHARARRAQFLVLRNRAFRNADPDAVHALFVLLSDQLRITIADDVEYTRRVPKLRRQLEGEYGVDVGEAPMPLSAVPQATPGEIGELALLQCPDSLD
ncbi:zinc finger MYND domain-containing protein [Phanerochaete sordida]|uniref:Zinc finger MYND domain-containing protein n=1 Tax=Phanerochaete sordida TaxID=48140 RepID=A0A9P3LB47_9APHY|nr:zinc finger MYND domain-containing protein [Phanerochaete sordida]